MIEMMPTRLRVWTSSLIRTAGRISGRNLIENDSFFYQDIIGCTVKYKGKDFGIVTDIFEGGAGDILVIEDSKKDRNGSFC